MSDEIAADTNMPENPPPFSGPGEAYRRDARFEDIRLGSAMQALRNKTGDDDADTIRKQVDVHIARIATLNSLAESQENAATQANYLKNAEASLKNAEASLKHSEALVTWTKVMVIVIAVQAVATIATAVVALRHR